MRSAANFAINNLEECIVTKAYQSFDQLPLMLNASDISSVLGISKAFAYNLFQLNSFPAISVGKRLMVKKDSFLLWLENHERKEA